MTEVQLDRLIRLARDLFPELRVENAYRTFIRDSGAPRGTWINTPRWNSMIKRLLKFAYERGYEEGRVQPHEETRPHYQSVD